MTKVLLSALDFARDAYDKAFRELVNQMRTRMRKSPQASSQDVELMIKYLPEELEHWAQNTKGWTTKDFEETRWAHYAIIDWKDDKNKARIWALAHDLLKREENKMMASWKTSA